MDAIKTDNRLHHERRCPPLTKLSLREFQNLYVLPGGTRRL